MIKALVTGGAGFIGSNLVDKLISIGYEVICIDNEFANNDNFYWNSNARNFKADITMVFISTMSDDKITHYQPKLVNK